MKSKQYNNQILISILLVFTIHFTFFFLGMYHLTLKSMLSIDGFLFIIYFLSSLIISPGLDKASDTLIRKVVILKLIQFLAALFSIVLFNVTKIHNSVAVSCHLLAVFLMLMAIQSVLLVKRIRG